MTVADADRAAPPAAAEVASARTLASHQAKLLLAALGAAVAIVLIGAFTTHGFLTVANLKAILFSASFVGIAAVSATLVMISGNLFSLSLGTTISISAIAFLAALHLGLFVAIVLALLLGVAIFAIQGLVVGAWNTNSIIVTIAAGSIQLGLATKLTAGAEVTPSGNSAAYKTLGEPLLGLPFSFYVLVGLTLLLGFVLHRTSFGRLLYLMGENRAAARAAGMRIKWITAGAFALAGLAAATTGILLGAFNDTATLAAGGTYTYEAIAAALVGGNAIQGGSGSVWRAFFGAFFIAAITNLLLLRGYSTGVQELAQGIAVAIAVVLMRLFSRSSR